MLGRGGVGKTFLCDTIENMLKKMKIEGTEPTEDFEVHMFNLYDPFSEEGLILSQNEPIEITIYDIGGQKRSSIGEKQLRTALKLSRVVVFVADSTDPSSLESIIDQYYPIVKDNYLPLKEGKKEPLIAIHVTKIGLDNALAKKGDIIDGNYDNNPFIKRLLEIGQKIDAKIISIGDSKNLQEYLIKGPKGLIKDDEGEVKPLETKRIGSGIPTLICYEAIKTGFADSWIRPENITQTLKSIILR